MNRGFDFGDVLGNIFGVGGFCVSCHKAESEVGELRIYPPQLRTLFALQLNTHQYCGSCAIRKAVKDTTK